MKPYVICHMMPSLDGRLDVNRWDVPEAAHKEYDRTADTYRADGWLCGRVTMEEFAAGKWRGVSGKRVEVPDGDWVAPERRDRYAVALDSGGKLAWTSDCVEDGSLIVILARSVPRAYLAYLRAKNISYIFAGKRAGEVSLATALTKLRALFGIQRLLVEGGGKTTGSFLEAGLIDEVSLLLTPVADGGMGEPALFDTVGRRSRKALSKMRIMSVRKAGAGMFWLKAKPRK